LLRRYAREELLASERAALLRADGIPAPRSEQDDWDSTVGDGID
jgi:hypothetical protein